MKKQRNLLISMLALLVLLVGAYLLYNRLSDSYAPDTNLVTAPGSENVQSGGEETDTFTAGNSDDKSASGDSAADSSAGDSSATDSSADDSSDSASQKQAAPDFTVYDYDGNAHKLSDFIGKPVILNFWASWCGPCKSEMPEFDSAYAKYGEDINFLIVNLTDGASETVETAKSYIDGEGYTFPVYYDTDIDAAMKYGVSSIPATYFIDSEGNLAAYGIGAMDGATLERGIGMVYTAEE